VQEQAFAARKKGNIFVSHQQEIGVGDFDDVTTGRRCMTADPRSVDLGLGSENLTCNRVRKRAGQR
jgi:hypothetical protein